MSRRSAKILTPNISYESREIRILAGSTMLIALMLITPTPMGLWGLTALISIPVIASGIIAWDPIYAFFGINRYNEAEGEIQQRRWSCSNVGTVDRIARFGIGILLLGTALTSTEIAWQSITTLLAIPVIMSAILAWDPLYALAFTNTFASKSDVQSADPELQDATLARFYHFPSVTPADETDSFHRAA